MSLPSCSQSALSAKAFPRLISRTAASCPLRVRCVSEAPSSLSTDAPSFVPRRCNLKELSFTDDGRLVSATSNQPPSPLPSKSSELLDLFAATVEASAQVKDLETLTGRLSMVAFFVAIAIEYSTGSGFFSAIDHQLLQRSLGLALLASVGAGAFAVALRGKKNVTDILSTGCKRWMDSTVDSLVDALFFEDSLVAHESSNDTRKQRL